MKIQLPVHCSSNLSFIWLVGKNHWPKVKWIGISYNSKFRSNHVYADTPETRYWFFWFNLCCPFTYCRVKNLFFLIIIIIFFKDLSSTLLEITCTYMYIIKVKLKTMLGRRLATLAYMFSWSRKFSVHLYRIQWSRINIITQ